MLTQSKRSTGGWIVGAVLALAANASAQPAPASAEQKAQVAYEAAEIAYGDKKYEVALVNYQAAYDYFQDPAMLVNIAQCHRFLGRPSLAIDFFQRFLAVVPASPYRPEIESLIAELRSLLPASVPASAPPKEPAPAWHRPASLGLAGAGALTLGLGLFAAQRVLQSSTGAADDTPGLLALEEEARGRRILVGTMLGGSALLVAAPVVFVLGKRSVRPGLAPRPDGAALTLSFSEAP